MNAKVAAERAISIIRPVAGEWVAKIYGIRGKRRRLAITATGSLDYTRRVSAVYGALVLEVDNRAPLVKLVADAARAANDCEVP